MRVALIASTLATAALPSVVFSQATPFTRAGSGFGDAFGSSVSTVITTPTSNLSRPNEALAISSSAGPGLNTFEVEIWRFGASGWFVDETFLSTSTLIADSSFGSSMDLRANASTMGTFSYEGLIGDPTANGSSPPSPGEAYVITPSTPGNVNLPATFAGSGLDGLGTAVAVTDLDLDGTDEYLIGSPDTIAGGPGRVDIYDSNLQLVDTLVGPNPGSLFGTSIAVLGNGEFAVGAPGGGSLLAGTVTVYSGLPAVAVQTVLGPVFSNTGQTLGNAGDVNGDGLTDFYAGQPLLNADGRVTIYDRATGAPLTLVLPAGTGQAPPMGTLVAGGKDIDGDRVFDVVVPSTTPGDLVTAYSGATGAPIGVIPRGPGDTAAVTSLALIDADGLGHNQVAIGQAGALTAATNAGLVRILSIPIPIGYPFCAQPDAAASSSGAFPTVVPGGSASMAANDLTFTTAGLPANSFASHFFGDDQSWVPAVFQGPSTLCVSGQTHRFPSQSTGGSGSITTAVDFSVPPGSLAMAGDHWFVQCIYRDTSGSGPTFKLSSALAVQITP